MTERKAIVFAVMKPFAISADNKDLTILYNDKTKSYSGGFKDGQPMRGIPLEMEAKIPAFAQTIATTPTSDQWFKEVNDYWAEFTYPIKFGKIINKETVGGTEIDASYEEQDGKVYPKNLRDYCLYEMLVQDRHVAKDKDAYSDSLNYAYFLVDKGQELQDEKDGIDLKREYITKLSKVLDEYDAPKLRIVISGLMEDGESIFGLKSLSLGQLQKRLMDLGGDKQSKFLLAIKDKELTLKARIKELVEASILVISGNTYFYLNESIGDLDDMLRYMKSPDNTQTLEKMKQKLTIYTTDAI